MPGRYLDRCSSVPRSISSGPTMRSPLGSNGGSPRRWYSSAKTYCCATDQPVPPCSTGQDGAAQPRPCRILCQAMTCSNGAKTLVVLRPASRISGVGAVSRNSETSARNASSPPSGAMSTGSALPGGEGGDALGHVGPDALALEHLPLQAGVERAPLGRVEQALV